MTKRGASFWPRQGPGGRLVTYLSGRHAQVLALVGNVPLPDLTIQRAIFPKLGALPAGSPPPAPLLHGFNVSAVGRLMRYTERSVTFVRLIESQANENVLSSPLPAAAAVAVPSPFIPIGARQDGTVWVEVHAAVADIAVLHEAALTADARDVAISGVQPSRLFPDYSAFILCKRGAKQSALAPYRVLRTLQGLPQLGPSSKVSATSMLGLAANSEEVLPSSSPMPAPTIASTTPTPLSSPARGGRDQMSASKKDIARRVRRRVSAAPVLDAALDLLDAERRRVPNSDVADFLGAIRSAVSSKAALLAEAENEIKRLREANRIGRSLLVNAQEAYATAEQRAEGGREERLFIRGLIGLNDGEEDEGIASHETTLARLGRRADRELVGDNEINTAMKSPQRHYQIARLATRKVRSDVLSEARVAEATDAWYALSRHSPDAKDAERLGRLKALNSTRPSDAMAFRATRSTRALHAAYVQSAAEPVSLSAFKQLQPWNVFDQRDTIKSQCGKCFKMDEPLSAIARALHAELTSPGQGGSAASCKCAPGECMLAGLVVQPDEYATAQGKGSVFAKIEALLARDAVISAMTCTSPGEACFRGACDACSTTMLNLSTTDGKLNTTCNLLGMLDDEMMVSFDVIVTTRSRSADDEKDDIDVSLLTERKSLADTVTYVNDYMTETFRPHYLAYTVQNNVHRSVYNNIFAAANGKTIILTEMDFSEKFSFSYKVDTQAMYRTPKTVTMLMLIVHWMDDEGQRHKEAFSYLSTSRAQDSAFVQRALQDSARCVREKLGRPFDLNIIQSDNCASHFKQRDTMAFMARYGTNIGSPATKFAYIFTGPGHGKGQVDGLGGTIKAHMRAICREMTIKSLEELVMWLRMRIGHGELRSAKFKTRAGMLDIMVRYWVVVFEPEDVAPATAVHGRAIPGILTAYSFASATIDGQLAVRTLSHECWRCLVPSEYKYGEQCQTYELLGEYRVVDTRLEKSADAVVADAALDQDSAPPRDWPVGTFLLVKTDETESVRVGGVEVFSPVPGWVAERAEGKAVVSPQGWAVPVRWLEFGGLLDPSGAQFGYALDKSEAVRETVVDLEHIAPNPLAASLVRSSRGRSRRVERFMRKYRVPYLDEDALGAADE